MPIRIREGQVWVQDGSATAQKNPQQQQNSGGDQNDHKQVSAARRLIKKAPNDTGSPDGPDSVTECIRLRPWIESVLGDRDIHLMRSAHLQKSVQKSVDSERVVSSGGGSRESRQSDVSSAPLVAGQGAAAECQGLVAVARGNYAAAANDQVRKPRIRRLRDCSVSSRLRVRRQQRQSQQKQRQMPKLMI